MSCECGKEGCNAQAVTLAARVLFEIAAEGRAEALGAASVALQLLEYCRKLAEKHGDLEGFNRDLEALMGAMAEKKGEVQAILDAAAQELHREMN